MCKRGTDFPPLPLALAHPSGYARRDPRYPTPCHSLWARQMNGATVPHPFTCPAGIRTDGGTAHAPFRVWPSSMECPPPPPPLAHEGDTQEGAMQDPRRRHGPHVTRWAPPHVVPAAPGHSPGRPHLPCAPLLLARDWGSEATGQPAGVGTPSCGPLLWLQVGVAWDPGTGGAVSTPLGGAPFARA